MPTIPAGLRLYNALINSGNIRYGTLPDGAAAVKLTAKAVAWTYDAWTQIVASVGAGDVLLAAIYTENPSAATDYDVNIGSGAGAAEVPLATVPIFLGVAGVLPFPILIAATTRLAGRTRSASGAANTIDVKVGVITGF